MGGGGGSHPHVELSPPPPRCAWSPSPATRGRIYEPGVAPCHAPSPPSPGRVAFFLNTDDFSRDHALLLNRGVAFLEVPRRESYGIVAAFRDIYGNKWDPIEPAEPD